VHVTSVVGVGACAGTSVASIAVGVAASGGSVSTGEGKEVVASDVGRVSIVGAVVAALKLQAN